MKRGALGELVMLCLLLPGCAGYAQRVAEALEEYEAGQPAAARDLLDTLRPGIDRHLTRLEKGMTNLAAGAPRKAVVDFSEALRQLEATRESLSHREVASFVLDDTVRMYTGAPFEQICARIFLALAYLLLPGHLEDALAACRDLDIKMEQIEALYERSYHLDAEGQPSDFSFQIPPIGKYIAALAAERRGELDSALLYMDQARRGLPRSRYFAREEDRMKRGSRDHLVYVFALVGMVPRKQEGVSEELTWLIRGIKAMYAIVRPEENPAALASVYWTAPVKIPEYPPRTPFWHGGFEIRTRAPPTLVRTEAVADFEQYARREYRELLPGILIRAAVRRILKESGGKWLSREATEDEETQIYLEALFSWVSAALETVDTRGWYTLPREFHAGALVLPEGVDGIELTPRGRYGQRLGPDIRVPIDRSRRTPALVLVIHPSPEATPIIVVDEAHRVSTPP